MILRIIIIICVLTAVLAALVNQSWLKSRRGRGDISVRILGITARRNTNFRRFQYLPIVITAAVIAIALGICINWLDSVVYLISAAVCFVVVMTATGAISSGSTASANSALTGDMAGSLKASYRTGAVMGASISAAGLLLLGAVFAFFETETVTEIITCLGLGASIVAAHLNTGGRVYSSAYSIAVPDDDFTDITGSFSGNGADLLESYILAGVAAVLMAQNGLDSSGVTSTFNLSSVTQYPLIILSSGIIASVIALFIYRGSSGVRNSRTVYITVFISGVLTAASAVYFSNYYLESIVYGIAAVCGIAGGLILGALSRIYAYDSRLMVSRTKEDRKLNIHMPLISGLSYGLVSAVFQSAVITACVYLAYNFASVYGIALAAVGFCSVILSIAAADGLAQLSGSASEIVRVYGERSDSDTSSDFLDTVSVRVAPSAWTYTIYASAVSIIAFLTAIVYRSGAETIDLLHSGFAPALIVGAAVPFVVFGIVIYSVRTTAYVALNKLVQGYETGTTGSLRWSVLPVLAAVLLPVLTGAFLGVECLLGFLIGAAATGCMIMPAAADSGIYFRNTAFCSMGSLIKIMLVLSAAFLPFFTELGGLFL